MLLLAYAGIAFSCRSASPAVTRQNFAPYYTPDKKPLNPSYFIFNPNERLSRLYFIVDAADLLYAKNNNDENYTARVMLNYILHPITNVKAIADSGQIVLDDIGVPGQQKKLAGSIDIDVPVEGRYFVEINFRDLNKATLSHAIMYLDHSNINASNNFLTTYPGTETPLFRNYVDPGESFSIRHRDPSVQKILVRYFKPKDSPAPPPYASIGKFPAPVADSSWTITTQEARNISFRAKGQYVFSISESMYDGMLINVLDEDYPKVTSAMELLFPMRYLTTKQEFIDIQTSANIKKSIDDFWLKSAGSEERARELIFNFYSRVEIANKQFTSSKEGWKTDRGMIYIIFGPPQNVYRNASNETWFYGNDIGSQALSFVFQHNTDAFSENEFILDRNMNYRINWIQAVDMWRQGQVYTAR
ncbi:MAG: hypothetical protein Fur0041_20260 [Bacteroidia bacterium]